jgi:Family of unknown function (DUF6174)
MTHLRISSILFAAIASVLLSAASCTPAADPTPGGEAAGGDNSAGALRQRWAQWQATGIRSYRFILERSCFCPVEAITPARVEVRDGRVVSARALVDGRELPIQSVPTIDSLFRWAIREAAQNGHVEVTYDPLRGHPVRLVIGTLANDAGTSYHVADLVVQR